MVGFHVWWVNTHQPPQPFCIEQLGIAGDMGEHGVTQVPSPPPPQKSIITFVKQQDTGASSPLPSSPLSGCHSMCKRCAHPPPVRTHRAMGERSQVQAAGQHSPSSACE